jgi:hypothetical protein
MYEVRGEQRGMRGCRWDMWIGESEERILGDGVAVIG